MKFASEGSRVWVRWLERVALLVAVVCLGWVAMARIDAAIFERAARASLPATETPSSGSGGELENEPAPARLAIGDVVGILDVPRLGLSEVVAEGDEDAILDVAVGHLPDTPLPWQPGNTAMAGHRDGHFRPLKDIAVGDTIRLRTKFGTFTYSVSRTLIVTPDDLTVLAPTPDRSLTLITCYPFSYIGRAPKRFVIQARATP